ncbi:hypothetical protein E2C01_082657 [Portunus trituberculatus]|uniref:Uncharacterized protein n=1 Tax=Portunus trituberculatus TaxID=210409 RepID=A0A5B7J5Q7_PORTR|nr:hypothetical protein [Portunus trituberculatus]
MYYLTQCEASLGLGRQTLRVQGEEVPLFPSGNGAGVLCAWQSMTDGKDVAEQKPGWMSGEMLPPHLEDLACQIPIRLMEDQTKVKRHLLCQYVDMFSQDELDLGCTSLEKHRPWRNIETSNSPPVKQALRRVQSCHSFFFPTRSSIFIFDLVVL